MAQRMLGLGFGAREFFYGRFARCVLRRELGALPLELCVRLRNGLR